MATEIFPFGLIEPHVHFRGYEQEEKEDPTTGTEASAASGVTIDLVMPNTVPAIDSPEKLEMSIAAMTGHIYVDVMPIYLATKDNFETFDQVKHLVAGFKLFETASTNQGGQDPRFLEDINAYIPEGQILLVHKVGSLKKTLDRARRHKTKIQIEHVYSAAQVQEIREARMAGVDVSAEVTDHHLEEFSDEEIARLGSHLKMLPAIIFDPNNRKALWDGIYDGTITSFGGDHAPHTLGQKAGFTEKDGPFGVPTLDTSFGIKATWVSKGLLTVDQLINMMYYNPMARFNLPDQNRNPNMPETYIEVDMDEKWTVTKEGLFTKCAWSPYIGREFTGRVKQTVLRNGPVYSSGAIFGYPRGQVLRPVAA